MDCLGVFSFVIILKEALQLLPKNGKLMALIALLSVLLSVITFVAFGFSIIGLSQDMASAAKSSLPHPSSFAAFNPRSSTSRSSDFSKLQNQLDHMKQILVILYAVEIAFIFIFYIISFVTTMATILVAAVSRAGRTLSMKDLFSKIARTWTKPFLTSIYVSLHAFGVLAILGLFAAPVVIYPNLITISIATFCATVALFFYLYLVVIWALAIVISVVEQGCYGMVAMGKASELVRGQRLRGYMLSLAFFLLSLIMLVIYQMNFRVKRPLSAVNYGLFVVGFSYLVKILQVVAYTVFYFHCKEQHGEKPEIDHIGVAKYELLPTTNPAKF